MSNQKDCSIAWEIARGSMSEWIMRFEHLKTQKPQVFQKGKLFEASNVLLALEEIFQDIHRVIESGDCLNEELNKTKMTVKLLEELYMDGMKTEATLIEPLILNQYAVETERLFLKLFNKGSLSDIQKNKLSKEVQRKYDELLNIGISFDDVVEAIKKLMCPDLSRLLSVNRDLMKEHKSGSLNSILEISKVYSLQSSAETLKTCWSGLTQQGHSFNQSTWIWTQNKSDDYYIRNKN